MFVIKIDDKYLEDGLTKKVLLFKTKEEAEDYILKLKLQSPNLHKAVIVPAPKLD